MRHVARDGIGVPCVELPLLRADSHGEAAADDEAELLVLVLVLGDAGVRFEVDDGQRHPLARDRARMDAFAKNVRPDFVQLEEGAHSTTRSMIVAVPRPPPQHIVSRP